MATHSSVLPGESQGWGSLMGCRLWGRTESDTTEATWQQQQQQVNNTSVSKDMDLSLYLNHLFSSVSQSNTASCFSNVCVIHREK